MTPQELLEGALKGALILNPITGPAALPYVIQEEMRKRTAAQAAKKPEEPKAPEAPEAPQAQSGPGGYADPGTDYSPERLPLPTGGIDLNILIPLLEGNYP